ncbi:MAG: aspartate kinase, monofunctional class [Candidatus Brockarchaeota archaeon]|nr:aspartate kinase, monofunctional class [Candidatus Brockarchaeota archaeon]
MRYVMKFGGSSVKDAGYGAICDLVSDYKGNEIVVVVSALKGATDGLLRAAKKAESGDRGWVQNFLIDFKKAHDSVVGNCIAGVPAWLEEGLSRAGSELEQAFQAIMHLREASPRSVDYILSFGERYSSLIACAALVSRGIKSKSFTGGEAGIITNDRFGGATPIMEFTREKARSILCPLLEEGFVPVVGGFAGKTKDGIVTTLGRGGSDYTATILADAVDADEVIIWSDVDGIMTADPKIEPGAITVPEITYEEATDMVVLGAKSMHPRALEPLIEKRIPLRLKNTFNPRHDGTLVTDKLSRPFPSVVKVISMVNGVGMLTIKGSSMVGEPGTAARFFNMLAEAKINIMMISQSISETNISVVIKREFLEKAQEILGKEVALGGGKVEIEPDVSVIAAVGEGMKGTPGVAARMFRAVANVGVNIRMISQGSSELNVSFVTKEADAVKAVRALHEEFINRARK